MVGKKDVMEGPNDDKDDQREAKKTVQRAREICWRGPGRGWEEDSGKGSMKGRRRFALLY